jgi:hypothetical protein
MHVSSPLLAAFVQVNHCRSARHQWQAMEGGVGWRKGICGLPAVQRPPAAANSQGGIQQLIKIMGINMVIKIIKMGIKMVINK